MSFVKKALKIKYQQKVIPARTRKQKLRKKMIKMIQWLKTNKYASVILFVLRIYVGYEWLTAGWEKLTGETPFSAAGFLKGAIDKPVIVSHTKDVLQYPTLVSFLKSFALPHVGIFNFAIPLGEFLVGLGLILGCLTSVAMFFGLLMNFMYVLSGTISSNPWLILLGSIVLVSNPNAGMFGLDRWVMPYIRRVVFKKQKYSLTNDKNTTTVA